MEMNRFTDNLKGAGLPSNERTVIEYLCDSHTHLGAKEEVEERIRENLCSLICATDPEEADKLCHLLTETEQNPLIIPTFGLHPWRAGRYSVSDMEPYFSQCSVIGEIGLDSVWCNVPAGIQEKAFISQLAIACEMNKPVILHTKGQEEKIASLIRRYPNTYLVHWYSSSEPPNGYLDLDCYFSIGPDVWWNPDVRKLAAMLPTDRILIETDGLGAVKWAWEEAPCHLRTPEFEAATRSVTSSLSCTLKQVADIRGLPRNTLSKQIRSNFESCFKISAAKF